MRVPALGELIEVRDHRGVWVRATVVQAPALPPGERRRFAARYADAAGRVTFVGFLVAFEGETWRRLPSR